MIGKKIGSWTILASAPKIKHRRVWTCQCVCGRVYDVLDQNLKNGGSIQCRVCKNLKHGKEKHPIYYIWRSMKSRCLNPHNKQYSYYGGRGITICDRWMIFENFYADMGNPPKGKSLDRINNDAGYDSANCRWATPKQQANNRRKARPRPSGLKYNKSKK